MPRLSAFEVLDGVRLRTVLWQAYTLTTAGREGMLALLPVFMDHILFPVITPNGFTTEVPSPHPLPRWEVHKSLGTCGATLMHQLSRC